LQPAGEVLNRAGLDDSSHFLQEGVRDQYDLATYLAESIGKDTSLLLEASSLSQAQKREISLRHNDYWRRTIGGEQATFEVLDRARAQADATAYLQDICEDGNTYIFALMHMIENLGDDTFWVPSADDLKKVRILAHHWQIADDAVDIIADTREQKPKCCYY
jgi:hypothetical protein